jgi:hypothetical protein
MTSELGSNGVAMEVTQERCPSSSPLRDNVSAILSQCFLSCFGMRSPK